MDWIVSESTRAAQADAQSTAAVSGRLARRIRVSGRCLPVTA